MSHYIMFNNEIYEMKKISSYESIKLMNTLLNKRKGININMFEAIIPVMYEGIIIDQSVSYSYFLNDIVNLELPLTNNNITIEIDKMKLEKIIKNIVNKKDIITYTDLLEEIEYKDTHDMIKHEHGLVLMNFDKIFYVKLKKEVLESILNIKLPISEEL